MINRASFILASGIVFVMPLHVSATDTVRSLWPKEDGVYIVSSVKSLPAFPKKSPGYKYAGQDRDYFDDPIKTKGTIRLKNGGDWEEIPSFPYGMNKCVYGRYMIRWWTANNSISISSTSGSPDMASESINRTGVSGYMQGSLCDEPLFKLTSGLRGNKSDWIGLYYEIKFWKNTYWWDKKP